MSDYTKLIEADAAKIRNALERLRGIGLAAGNSALTQGTIALAALDSLEAILAEVGGVHIEAVHQADCLLFADETQWVCDCGVVARRKAENNA